MEWHEVFIQSVRKAYSFLEIEHGFCLESTDGMDAGASVKYTRDLQNSQKQIVTISACPRRLEFDFTVSQLPESEETSEFELEDIYPVACLAERKTGIYTAHTNPNSLNYEIEQSANRFKALCAEFFEDPIAFWRKVREYRRRTQETEKQQRLSEEAAKAFRVKDYERVVKLLNDAKLELNEVDRKRLHYAQKNL